MLPKTVRPAIPVSNFFTNPRLFIPLLQVVEQNIRTATLTYAR